MRRAVTRLMFVFENKHITNPPPSYFFSTNSSINLTINKSVENQMNKFDLKESLKNSQFMAA